MKSFVNLAIFVTAIATRHLSTAARSRFVSVDGDANQDCGIDAAAPCSTLDYIFGTLLPGDKVFISSTGSIHTPFLHCSDRQYTLNGSVELTGSGRSKAVIGCVEQNGGVKNKSRSRRARLRLVAARPGLEISLVNIEFRQIDITVSGFSVNARNCSFVQTKTLLESTSISGSVDVDLTRSAWQGYTSCDQDLCFPSDELHLSGDLGIVNLAKNKFQQTSLEVALTAESRVVFERNRMVGLAGQRPVQSGLTVVIAPHVIKTVVIVRHCVFRDQYHWNPIDSLVNLYKATLLMRVLNQQNPDRWPPNNITLLVSNVSFVNNERAITLQGPIEHVTVEDSEFRSNIVMHTGAGILILTNRTIDVRNCTFLHNAAGVARPTRLRDVTSGTTPLKIRGSKVVVESTCCNGDISLIGKGGAIRVKAGSLTVRDCHFKNNSANELGGAIFVDRKSKLRLHDTYMESTNDVRRSSQQGDIVYSYGHVDIRGSHLVARCASDHVSLLQHSGDRWSIAVYDVSVRCPRGYKLRASNTSALRIQPEVGLKRSVLLDQLSYFCESCPRYKYSLDRGFLHYQQEAGVVEYFTLMINGKSPAARHSGLYELHSVQCIDCPYGGDCNNNIRALPNFWGYVHEGKVAFQLCPKGYCCPASDCPSYNVCAPHRRGRLCGECVDGYTKTLISAACVPDDTCGHVWLWAAVFGGGVVCALLLVFHDDIFTFLSCSTICTPQHHTSGGFVDIRSTMIDRKSGEVVTQLDTAKGDNGAGCKTDEFTTAIRNHEPQPSCSTAPLESPDHEAAKATDDDCLSGSVLFIILIYFYQDASLLHVASTEDAVGDFGEDRRLPRALRLLGHFRRGVADFFARICLLPRLSTVHTLVARAALPAGVLFLSLLLLLFCCCCQRLGRRCLRRRLSVAAALTFLFTYQRLAHVGLTLLNCVSVGADSVLFVDGSVACLRPWQYAIIGYVFGSVVPFCGVFLLGPALLADGTVSTLQFLSACVFPLPFVLYWLYVHLLWRMSPRQEWPSTSDKARAQALPAVLHAPFRAGCAAWAGAVVARRLALVTLAAFVNNPLIRMFGMLVTIIMSLLTLAHTRPYRSHHANVADGATVSALFVVSLVNMVRAGFDTAEYQPRGPNRVLMTALDGLEDGFVFWLPAVAVASLMAVVALKGLLLGVFRMRSIRAPSLS